METSIHTSIPPKGDRNIHIYTFHERILLKIANSICNLSFKESSTSCWILYEPFPMGSLQHSWGIFKCWVGFGFNINLFLGGRFCPNVDVREIAECSVKPGWPCLFPSPLIPHSPLSLHQSMHCIALHCIALHCIAPELPALHRSPMRACKVGHVSTSRLSLGSINTFFALTLLMALRHATLHPV